ncbi:MAG: histidinol-phosphatase [Alphaproteobacteria bacterium]
MAGLNGRLEFAEKLAEAAGEAIRPLFRAHGAVDDKAAPGSFDPVTQADKAAERAMRALIAQYFPDDGVLGEEEDDVPSRSGYTWVLDPIDGTRAFILGLPLWGTLIALNDGTRPIYGVLDQPYTGERWLGGEGRNKFVDQAGTRVLQTSATTQLADAMIMATHPEIFSTQAEQAAFGRVADQCRMVRWGGDCYGYGLLAMGQVDLVIESSLKAFDIQALIPIIEAAGGLVTDWQGNTCYDGGQILAAANPALHEVAMVALKG